MVINLKVKRDGFFLFIGALCLGVLNALKREAFGADFLTYEQYYYERVFFVEPIYFAIQNLFSFSMLPFSLFWALLTTFSIYQVGLFSFDRAKLKVFYIFVLPMMFFLTLAGHSRSGFALGLFCWSMNRGNSVSRSLFIGGLMHVGAMVVFFVRSVNVSQLFLCGLFQSFFVEIFCPRGSVRLLGRRR